MTDDRRQMSDGRKLLIDGERQVAFNGKQNSEQWKVMKNSSLPLSFHL
jgi:hypothetical protein